MAMNVRVLLLQDDDGDALLVEEMLREVGAAVELTRAAFRLAEARSLVAGAACRAARSRPPRLQRPAGSRLAPAHAGVAVVMLTGNADEHLGAEAVRAARRLPGQRRCRR